MRNPKPTTATRHGNAQTFVFKEMESAPHVFVRNDAVSWALQPSYDGPCQAIKKHEKNFQMEKDGRKIRILAGRLKPGYTMAERKKTDKSSGGNAKTTAEQLRNENNNSYASRQSGAIHGPPTNRHQIGREK